MVLRVALWLKGSRPFDYLISMKIGVFMGFNMC